MVMITTIKKVGEWQGVILDSQVMRLAGLKVGDHLNLELHRGSTISLLPLHLNRDATTRRLKALVKKPRKKPSRKR